MDHLICKVLLRLCRRGLQCVSPTVRACTINLSWKSANAARQALRHRRVDYSSVLEEDRLCDTLGTNSAAVGGWSHKRQGRGCRVSRRSLRSGSYMLASHAGEASDESEQADSDREESNSGTVQIELMVGQSCLDCCVALFRGYGCRYFCVDTSVDFNTVQVKSTVQLHGLSFDECRKSHFNSIPDAVLCLNVDG